MRTASFPDRYPRRLSGKNVDNVDKKLTIIKLQGKKSGKTVKSRKKLCKSDCPQRNPQKQLQEMWISLWIMWITMS